MIKINKWNRKIFKCMIWRKKIDNWGVNVTAKARTEREAVTFKISSTKEKHPILN